MRYLFFLVLIGAFFSFSCKQDVVEPNPEWYELKQNWPNPFKDTTYISYGVPTVNDGPGPHIRLIIYDRFENAEIILVDRHNHPAMIDTVLWNGRNSNYGKSTAGIYYIELQEFNGTDIIVRARILALKQ
ncbi:MAG: hypothetical protein JXA06_04325 [Bacteroidetes bacterium]|nr:hypothetical protein [Bacteroidota bacterium]